MNEPTKPAFIKPNDLIEESRVAYEAGNRFALLPVFEYLRRLNAPIPDWVKKGISEQLHELLQVPVVVKQGGPHSTELKELRANQIHYRRWIVVKTFVRSGKSLEQSFVAARKALATQKDAKDISTIKKSYYNVERAISDPTAAWKFTPYRPLIEGTYIPHQKPSQN